MLEKTNLFKERRQMNMSQKPGNLARMMAAGLLTSASSLVFQEGGQSPGIPGWVWAVLVVLLVLLVAWWGLRSSRRETPSEPMARMETPPPAVQTFVPETGSPAAGATTVDDLEIIEGIGPRIAAILRAEGITSFRQLAETDTARLDEILIASNLGLADPGSWAEQARLADAGDQAGLKAYQDRLKGGRQV
jgi:predicted flap endonuclease-1-like 5' DNA nuclease